MLRTAKVPVLLGLVMVVAFGISAPATAKVPGVNGRIVFGRFNDTLGDFQIFTAHPDGSHQVQVLPGAAECPRWSPDGHRLLVCLVAPSGLLRPATVRPDGSGLVLLDNPDPTLNIACWAWSVEGSLACEGWDDTHPSRRAGIFTVRASDGGHLERVSANPYGSHDIAGDFSPDGSRIVFLRNTDPDSETGALFVVGADGEHLQRITGWSFAEDPGSWSPDGQWIAFSNANGKLWFVHPDGSGLHRIDLDVAGRTWASQPSWSPDGQRLVLRIYRFRTDEAHIYTIDPSGGDVREVGGTTWEEFPDWGPRPGDDDERR